MQLSTSSLLTACPMSGPLSIVLRISSVSKRVQRCDNPLVTHRNLSSRAIPAHHPGVRALALLPLVFTTGWAGAAFGTWQMNAARSMLAGDIRPQSLTLRIEPHAKGEVFTLDRVEADGRATSTSSILYLDGEPRPYQDFGCSGIQASRRVDGGTVEILRMCASGAWVRLIRRSALPAKELLLEITEQRSDGRRVERRLILEKR